jgi:hypothetical protein
MSWDVSGNRDASHQESGAKTGFVAFQLLDGKDGQEIM